MKLNSVEWFDDVGAGSWVTRYHTMPMLHPQSVGHHSHMVAMTCYWLLDGVVTSQLLMAALVHDLPEAHTGDIPAPAKLLFSAEQQTAMMRYEREFLEFMGVRVKLTPDEHSILKWADTLELIMHCLRDYRLGNKFARKIAMRGIGYAKNYPRHEKAEQLLLHLEKQLSSAYPHQEDKL